MQSVQQDLVNNDKLANGDILTKRLVGTHDLKVAFLSAFINALQTTVFTELNWRSKEVESIPEGVGILKEMTSTWEQFSHEDVRKVDELFNHVNVQLQHSRALDGGDQATVITKTFYQNQIAAMQAVLNNSKKQYHL